MWFSSHLKEWKMLSVSFDYIGKTKWHLLVRQYEHLGLTEKARKYTQRDATAIRKHCHENKHRCSMDNFEIVGTAVNDFHLKLKESLLILKMKSCSNIAQESLPLYLFDNDSWNAIGK